LTPLVIQDLQDIGLPPTIPAAFKPDSLWSYELGSKSRLLDNRLSLNVAAFYIDWKNIQQDVVLPASGFDFETNVGKAKGYGLEIEGRFRATDQLTLNAAASWTRAVFAEDQPALGTVDGNLGSPLNVRKGDPVQGVPRYSARLGFDYRFHPFSSGQAFVRGSGQWTGSSHGTFIRASSDYLRPAYFTADASAGLSFDKWEFTVFAKNLGNNQKIIQRPSIQGVDEALYLRPRTIGVTAAYDF
jgi:outer membrane receptor protein involved in Fe transport